MSRMLALACATTLLSITGCNKASEEASKPAAEQAAPQAVAPAATEAAAPVPVPATPTMAAKPAEPAPAKPAKPASEQKPVEPVAAAPAPAAKPEAPVAKPEAPAAKPEAPAAKPVAPAAASPAVITKEQALALAGKGNCLACHKIESKVVGPAWKDVGAKYKGDANAAATIATHIKAGGSFGWKLGNMPPRGGSKISDADVESLAGFIASLR